MKQIMISDVTLRKAQEGTISFKEKVEIVKKLDKLNVDVIETCAITHGKIDVLFLHTVAPLIKNSILSCEVLCGGVSAEETFDAIKDAKRPRLHIMLPVSTVQMEYNLHKKPKDMLDLMEKYVSEASKVCDDVEVSLLDTTRSDMDFIKTALETAVNSGAKTITVCDTAGELLPTEFEQFVKEIAQSYKNVKIGVECSNMLHMGAASAISCINTGAQLIKTTSMGKECPTLKSIGNVFKAKSEVLDAKVKLDMTRLEKSVAQIDKMLGKGSSDFVRAEGESFSDFSLAPDSDIKTVTNAVLQLGYDLSEEDIIKVYEEFKNLAAKKTVGLKELDAIIASVAMQVPPTYTIKSYVINNGNHITATAQVELYKDGEICFGLCKGDGPIDAAFMAVEQGVGMHFELDDFQIQSVTEGREAMGSALVKLRSGGKLYSGRGISTDIVGASINAYVSAINKICFEEEI